MTIEAKIYWCFLLFVPLLFSNTCKAQKDKDTELVEAIIGTTWIHSYEEDGDSGRVYRSETYEFPRSRGREGFRMEQDSAFLYYAIAPTDGTVIYKGHWGIENDFVVVDFPRNEYPMIGFVFKVVQLEDERLTVMELRVYDE